MIIDCWQSTETLSWLCQRLEIEQTEGLASTIAFRDNTNKILAVVAYTDYTIQSVEMSIAADSPRWMTRQTIQAALAYPFRQLKVARVTANTLATNQRTIKMLSGLGFQLEGALRNYGPAGESRLIYGLLAEEFEQWEKAVRLRRLRPIQLSLPMPRARLISKPLR